MLEIKLRCAKSGALGNLLDIIKWCNLTFIGAWQWCWKKISQIIDQFKETWSEGWDLEAFDGASGHSVFPLPRQKVVYFSELSFHRNQHMAIMLPRGVGKIATWKLSVSQLSCSFVFRHAMRTKTWVVIFRILLCQMPPIKDWEKHMLSGTRGVAMTCLTSCIDCLPLVMFFSALYAK